MSLKGDINFSARTFLKILVIHTAPTVLCTGFSKPQKFKFSSGFRRPISMGTSGF
jgi:hypothetical protein